MKKNRRAAYFFGKKSNCNLNQPERKKKNPTDKNKDVGFVSKEEWNRVKWLKDRIGFSHYVDPRNLEILHRPYELKVARA